MHNLLLAYNTRSGSTKEIALKIAETIKATGLEVDLMHVSEISSVSVYDAVIVGSPIFYDKWPRLTVGFVKKFESELQKIPTAFFFSCMTLSSKEKSAISAAQKYADEIARTSDAVSPIDVKGFAGAVFFDKLPFYLRIPLGIILMLKGAKQGDYRDWSDIESWAKTMAERLG